MSDLRKLLDNMNQIDENPLVGLAVGAAGSMIGNALSDSEEVDEAWDEDVNHGLSDDEYAIDGHDKVGFGDDDDWMMQGGEDGLGPDGDGRHDRHGDYEDEYGLGEDPWGIGEHNDQNYPGRFGHGDPVENAQAILDTVGYPIEDYHEFRDEYINYRRTVGEPAHSEDAIKQAWNEYKKMSDWETNDPAFEAEMSPEDVAAMDAWDEEHDTRNQGGDDGFNADAPNSFDDGLGEDPWGIGDDGDRGEIAGDAFAQGINDPEACPDCLGSGTRTKAMWGPDAGYCEKCAGTGEIGFNPGPEGDRGEMAGELYDDERGENVPDDVQMSEGPVAREQTNKLIDAANDGLVDWESVAMAALEWMSEAEVAEMVEDQFDLDMEDMFDSEEQLNASAQGHPDLELAGDANSQTEPSVDQPIEQPNDYGIDGDDPWGIGECGADGNTAVERVQDRVAQRYGGETNEQITTSGVRG